jgi:hypothetical protein
MRLFLLSVFILFFWNIRPAVAQDDDWLPANRHLGSIRFTLLNDGIILGKAKLGDFPGGFHWIQRQPTGSNWSPGSARSLFVGLGGCGSSDYWMG